MIMIYSGISESFTDDLTATIELLEHTPVLVDTFKRGQTYMYYTNWVVGNNFIEKY